MSKILELFGCSTSNKSINWSSIVEKQRCPYLDKKCIKTRKSESSISIGTCTLSYGTDAKETMTCPHRMLERRQIFMDCIHLLTLHEPGNELHIIPEVKIPGGNVDYFLVSAKNRKVKDFVGIELQTLDTTGTVWPERQRFLNEKAIEVKDEDVENGKSFGMNWKMTAKTILVQMHHKIDTFEYLSKHLVLVVQNYLLEYMRKEFSFEHIENAKLGDSLHFHSYSLEKSDDNFKLELESRLSTDSSGMAKCLGLQAEAKVELEQIIAVLEKKLCDDTLLTIS